MFYEIFYGNRNLITPPKHGLGLLAERSVAMPVVLKVNPEDPQRWVRFSLKNRTAIRILMRRAQRRYLAEITALDTA